MRQRAFEFSVPAEPTLDLFVTGRNGELVERLRALDRPGGERCLYIWGPPGSGRTHLLKAALAQLEANSIRTAYVSADARAGLTDALRDCDAVAVDDVERLDETGQATLFGLYNALREAGKTLLVAGNVAPMQLPLRADVVTRLGWGLVYEVHLAGDSEKAEALAQHATVRGFSLAPEVREYLINHVPRDMPTLLAMLHALDRYSLEGKRAITVPLLRELLNK